MQDISYTGDIGYLTPGLCRKCANRFIAQSFPEREDGTMHFDDLYTRRPGSIGELDPLQMGQPVRAALQSQQSEYLMVGKADMAHLQREPQFGDTPHGEFQAMG